VYEGTTGIQALDLIGRKVLGSGGALVTNVSASIRSFCQEHAASPGAGEFIETLSVLNDEWEAFSDTLRERAIQDLEELGASSVDYLMYSGYVLYAYLWARMAHAAEPGRKVGGDGASFYAAKLATARFYYARLLPRAAAHKAAALAGAATVMSTPDAGFGS
jgi:hypothetical protein